jgi:hypothetical protein
MPPWAETRAAATSLPHARLLSVDMLFWAVSGRQEAASILALLQTALVLGGWLAARLLLGRVPS